MNNDFKIFLPFDAIEKSVDKQTGKTVMKIGGVISNSLTGPDVDGEVIDVEGMDFTKFLTKGFINYHHLAGKDPSAIIGEPTKAYVKNGKAYVEGILYPESEMAQKVYDLANTLSKSSSTRRLGYSIEGKAVERDSIDSKRIRKSMISGLAVTPAPKCGGTELTILKGEGDFDYQTQDGSEFLIDITDEQGVRWTVDKQLNIEKGGEGSRGGKVIGHTQSGKPIYESTEHSEHKNFTAQDHKDAFEAKLDATRDSHGFADSKHKMYAEAYKHKEKMKEAARKDDVIGHTSKGNPIHRDASHEAHKNFTKKEHKEAKNLHNEFMHRLDDGNKENEKAAWEHARARDFHGSKITKAIVAGDITGTETIDHNLTQQPLKQESVEGIKKKKKKIKDLSNKLSKAEVLTFLIEEGFDLESCKHIYQLAAAIENKHQRFL